MPDDYIKRSDALKAVCETCSEHGENGEPCDGHCGDYTLIQNIPAADVEPVVHCRDCKYRNQRIPVHNAICTKCYEMDCMQGYGFCSMGESDD